MTPDEFPEHWLGGLPDQPPDPLEPWRPTHRQRAATTALLLAYIAGETELAIDFTEFCSRAYTDQSWPQHLLALLERFKATAEGAQGHDLTVARAESAHQHALLDTLDSVDSEESS